MKASRSPTERRPRKRPVTSASTAARIIEQDDASLLDLVDNLLNQGVVSTGDAVLGLAGVDLIWLRLSALLSAADRVLSAAPTPSAQKRSRRRP